MVTIAITTICFGALVPWAVTMKPDATTQDRVLLPTLVGGTLIIFSIIFIKEYTGKELKEKQQQMQVNSLAERIYEFGILNLEPTMENSMKDSKM